MAQPIINSDGTFMFDSSLESKIERGYQEVVSWGCTSPSDGMIEFKLTIKEGKPVTVWMTCEKARRFCNGLHMSLKYHEKLGPRNKYTLSAEERIRLGLYNPSLKKESD